MNARSFLSYFFQALGIALIGGLILNVNPDGHENQTESSVAEQDSFGGSEPALQRHGSHSIGGGLRGPGWVNGRTRA